jgi:hypothetical protein
MDTVASRPADSPIACTHLMSPAPPCFERPDRCACSTAQSGPTATTCSAACKGPAP